MDVDGKLVTVEELSQNLIKKLLEFFKSEDELREIWSTPITRKALLDKLAAAGYRVDMLIAVQQLINAKKSDLFDVLAHISFATKPITRDERVGKARAKIFSLLDNKQKEFIEFVLLKYIETGVEELAQEKLPALLELKYHTVKDAEALLGNLEKIRAIFINFQKHLYG